ncbi:MAG TPA: hypothetical protein VJ753_00820 [Rhizomicrobium sp.]|nr:hypothetical protein [Rhizomicrobium sp.]
MSGRKFPKSFVEKRIEAGLELKAGLLKRLIADAKQGENGLHQYDAITLEGILAIVQTFCSQTEQEKELGSE